MKKTILTAVLAVALSGCAGHFVSLKHHESDMRDINEFFKAQRDLDKQFAQDLEFQKNLTRILSNENIQLKYQVIELQQKSGKTK